ncbi:MAG: hypothetical protein KAX49_13180 [Halanaerobiales bacterium]|nr:hypothetical protein [Halanaerobiales bacterium]
MKKVGLREVNRYLSKKTEKELKEEIKELYRLFPKVKEYYQSKISPENELDILVKYRMIIYKEFWHEPPKLRYSVMKKAISDFKKVSTQSENVADLMLSYVENGVEFTIN